MFAHVGKIASPRNAGTRPARVLEMRVNPPLTVYLKNLALILRWLPDDWYTDAAILGWE